MGVRIEQQKMIGRSRGESLCHALPNRHRGESQVAL
jgi:hypothetical protein